MRCRVARSDDDPYFQVLVIERGKPSDGNGGKAERIAAADGNYDATDDRLGWTRAAQRVADRSPEDEVLGPSEIFGSRMKWRCSSTEIWDHHKARRDRRLVARNRSAKQSLVKDGAMKERHGLMPTEVSMRKVRDHDADTELVRHRCGLSRIVEGVERADRVTHDPASRCKGLQLGTGAKEKQSFMPDTDDLVSKCEATYQVTESDALPGIGADENSGQLT